MSDIKGLGRIGVLMGGPSSEREISLKSGRAVYESLKQAGVDVLPIEIETGDVAKNSALIAKYALDCAFIALHGWFGEDGQIQSILETLKLPYTGSGVSASRAGMNKITAKKILSSKGIIVPPYEIIDKKIQENYKHLKDHIRVPVVVKPPNHGSSIGLSIIDRIEDLDAALEKAFLYDEKIILEDYISGREFTVGVVEENPLPVVEIIPGKKFFDYEAKYSSSLTEYRVPADISPEITSLLQDSALASHKALGCWGCSRVDIILGQDRLPYVLELNSVPGMTQKSLLPKAAEAAGIDFTGLCLKLIKLAYEKQTSNFSTEG
jgi:D-alanine--D-alanine ligase